MPSVLAQGVIQFVAEGVDAVIARAADLVTVAEAATTALGRTAATVARLGSRGLSSAFVIPGQVLTGVYNAIERLRAGLSSIRFAVRGINHLFSLLAQIATAAFGGLFYIAARNTAEWSDFKDAIKDLADVVGESLAPYVRLLTSAIRGLTDIFKALNPQVRQTIVNYTVLSIIISQLATGLITRISSALAGIVKLVGVVFNILASPIRVFGQLMAFVISTILDLAAAIIQTLTPVLAKLIGLILDVAIRFIYAASILAIMLLPTIIDLAAFIGSKLIMVLAMLVKGLIAVAITIGTVVINSFLYLIQTISLAASLFASMALSLIANAVMAAASTIAAIISIVAAFLALIAIIFVVIATFKLMASLVVGILGMVINIINGVANGMQAVAVGINNVVQQGVQQIPIMKNAIFDFVRALRNDLPGALKMAAMGFGNLYNSFVEGFGKMVTAAKQMAQSIQFEIVNAIMQIRISIMGFFAEQEMLAEKVLSEYKGWKVLSPAQAVLGTIAKAVKAATSGSMVEVTKLAQEAEKFKKKMEAPVKPFDVEGMKIDMKQWEKGIDAVIDKMKDIAPVMADQFKRIKAFAGDLFGLLGQALQPGAFTGGGKSKFEAIEQTWKRLVTADEGTEDDQLEIMTKIWKLIEQHFPDMAAALKNALPAVQP